MSHEKALEGDARRKLSAGQTLTTVVLEDNVDKQGKALAKHQKVSVFIKTNGIDLGYGDTVLIKIADARVDSALAVALEKVT